MNGRHIVFAKYIKNGGYSTSYHIFFTTFARKIYPLLYYSMSNETHSTPNILKGLSSEEVLQSRTQHGENVLTPPAKTPTWKLYLEKYNDPIIKILLIAAVISLILSAIEGEYIETIGIFLAIFLATTIGFCFERSAAKKFEMLTALGEEQLVKVRRNSTVTEVARKDIVVGDVVLVEAGDEIPADGELAESSDLQLDESSLTGEPIIDKHADRQKNDPNATYPSYQLLRSSMVMNGRGTYLVTAVGDATEIGKVARSSSEETNIKTPLNLQLDRLARIISKFGFAVSAIAFVLFLGHDILTNDAVWRSNNYMEIALVTLKYFMMAVTLIVMAVPEGLPMAVTLSLALNMRRMLKSNNLVRKLHACETMGAVTVICTDKTGTLTQNKMQVAQMKGFHPEKDLFCQMVALNTTAFLDESNDRGIGNPTEIALLLWLHKEGKDYRATRNALPIENQLPFSTQRKFMATVAAINGKRYLFIKGAPEIIMDYCQLTAEQRLTANESLLGYQRKAMRTLAFAMTELTDNQHLEDLEKLRGTLTLQAIAAISDPIRQDVPAAVGDCRKAGINVKIVTGDTSATAIEIARQIGIWNDETPNEAHITGTDFAALNDEEAFQRVKQLRVVSRARPSDKQRLVQLLQKHGEVVAVTGDGTNDAPALHYAQVGLSLGSSTSVAKEASDMTLLDDSFKSITSGVMWGRSLYKNIQRFLFFQLVVNVAALLLVLGGSVIGKELPLTVTQILWVNLIMDTFAAMALASLPPSREVMADKPRNPTDFILSKPILREIALVSGLIFVVMFGFWTYFMFNGAEDGIVRHELTLFFTAFVMAQFWNLFNAKALCSIHSAFRRLWTDSGLLLVLALILVGQWLIVEFGGEMFRTDGMSLVEWIAVTAMTSVVMWIGELWRALQRLKAKR